MTTLVNFGRSARAALRAWQDTIAASRLCKADGACHTAHAGVPPCTRLTAPRPTPTPRG